MANVHQNQCLYITNLSTTSWRQQQIHSIHQRHQNPSRHDLAKDVVSFACINLIPSFVCSMCTTFTRIVVAVSLQWHYHLRSNNELAAASESISTRFCQGRHEFCLCRFHPIIFLLTFHAHSPTFNAPPSPSPPIQMPAWHSLLPLLCLSNRQQQLIAKRYLMRKGDLFQILLSGT